MLLIWLPKKCVDFITSTTNILKLTIIFSWPYQAGATCIHSPSLGTQIHRFIVKIRRINQFSLLFELSLQELFWERHPYCQAFPPHEACKPILLYVSSRAGCGLYQHVDTLDGKLKKIKSCCSCTPPLKELLCYLAEEYRDSRINDQKASHGRLLRVPRVALNQESIEHNL